MKNPETFEEIKVGDRIAVPRFETVLIEEIYQSEKEARHAGYTEPTHLYDMPYKVLGKSIDMYHMKFAVCKQTLL